MLSALALAGMTCTSADESPPTTPVAGVAPVAAMGLDAMPGRAVKLAGTAPADRQRFIALSVGENHNCALREDGRALCWGEHQSGQLLAPGDERFVAISAGKNHSCGLREDGAALCWGRWSHQGPAATSLLDQRFVAISSGGEHTCGLRENGMAICWSQAPSGDTKRWPILSDTFIAVFSLGSGSCGIRADGAAVCWDIGIDSVNQSIGWTKEYGLVHQYKEFGLNEERGLASVSRGGQCSLKISGELSCPERKPDVANPDVLSDERLKYMGGSWDRDTRGFICGVRPDGSAVCWILGQRSEQDWNIPMIPASQKFLDIGAGEDHACGLLADGSIKCWGSNHHGQGVPPTSQTSPTPMPPNEVICKPGIMIVKGSGCSLPKDTEAEMRRFAVTADGLGVVYGEADEIYETRHVSISVSFFGRPVPVRDGWFRLNSNRRSDGARCEGAGTRAISEMVLSARPSPSAETRGVVADVPRDRVPVYTFLSANADAGDFVAKTLPAAYTECIVFAARADADGNWIVDKTLVWERYN